MTQLINIDFKNKYSNSQINAYLVREKRVSYLFQPNLFKITK